MTKENRHMTMTQELHDMIYNEGMVINGKVTVGVYLDTIVSDFWDNPEKYGDDNDGVVILDKADFDEWHKETFPGESEEDFWGEYIYDWNDGLVGWLEDHGKEYDVYYEEVAR